MHKERKEICPIPPQAHFGQPLTLFTKTSAHLFICPLHIYEPSHPRGGIWFFGSILKKLRFLILEKCASNSELN